VKKNKGIKILTFFYHKTYATFYIIVSPLGAFLETGKGKKIKIGAFISRGANATFYIIVSPFGLLRHLNHLNLLNPLNLIILFIPDLLPNEIWES